MNKILYPLIVIAVVIYFNKKNNTEMYEQKYIPPETVSYIDKPLESVNNNFVCDGRTYCSEMTSCEEATYFLNNCPNPKMDGNHDGVPCESQWCY